MQSESTTLDPAANAFFASTKRYIEFQKKKGGAMGEKYDPINVWLFWARYRKILGKVNTDPPPPQVSKS